MGLPQKILAAFIQKENMKKFSELNYNIFPIFDQRNVAMVSLEIMLKYDPFKAN